MAKIMSTEVNMKKWQTWQTGLQFDHVCFAITVKRVTLVETVELTFSPEVNGPLKRPELNSFKKEEEGFKLIFIEYL